MKHETNVWKAAFEATPGVKPLSKEIYQGLARVLNLAPNNILAEQGTTPGYYSFTGRKGIWIYRDGEFDAACIICLHPNIDGNVLIFPEIPNCSGQLIDKLLTEMPKPPGAIELARVSQERQTEYIDIMRGGKTPEYLLEVPAEILEAERMIRQKYNIEVRSSDLIDESTLGWGNRIRVGDTTKIATVLDNINSISSDEAITGGPAFRRFRRAIRHTTDRNVNMRIIDIDNDYKSALDVIINWAATKSNLDISELKNFTKNVLNPEEAREITQIWICANEGGNMDIEKFKELIAPYFKLLEELKQKNFQLIGYVMMVDGAPEGLAIVEKSNNVAITHANLANRTINGLSYRLVAELSRELLQTHGINRLNLDGSEDVTLDEFKANALGLEKNMGERLKTIRIHNSRT